ncbi:MAG: PHP domain-containing protein [Clostridia bacterium]
MRYYIDLHIHTTLSPCADQDMTPNNIVNMAVLKGLDFIAVTDHNSTGNVRAVMECAQETGLVVVPGMEIESSEEVHMLCFFPNVSVAEVVGNLVYNHLPNIQNRPGIFGCQEIYNSKDELIGCEEKLLLTATLLSIDKIKAEVERLGGVVVPSHIDRQSFSIISNLGFIPKELGFAAVEISKNSDRVEFLRKNPNILHYKSITNSDAHHLSEISEVDEGIDLKEKSIAALLSYLKIRKI